MTDRADQIAALRLPLADLPDPLPIPTIARPFDAAVRPPGSKSITNRALLLAALAEGTSTLRGALTDADDAQVMIAALRRLGATIEAHPQDTLQITGVAGRWKLAPGEEARLDLHNAGTATRFLAAAALLAPPGASVIIDGDARMRQRPIEELGRALDTLTDPVPCVEYLGTEGYPPVRIRPDRMEWASGMAQTFGRTQSSQFISALLLIAPFMPYGIEITFSTSDITSRSYIDMTIGLLRKVGVTVDAGPRGAIAVRSIHRTSGKADGRTALPAFTLDIEPDASGATYFEAAAAIIPGSRMLIDGLDLGPRGSLQGDTRFIRIIDEAGATVSRGRGLIITGADRLRPLDVDLADMPDTAMTAAVLACFAQPPTSGENAAATSTLRGLRTLRVKETDRLAALHTELGKLGAHVEILSDRGDESLRITPPPPARVDASPRHLTFATYNDHRMAMALALIGLRLPGVVIENPACVAKTYPRFWHDLSRLYDAPQVRT